MPIAFDIWRLTNLDIACPSTMDAESKLEKLLAHDVQLLGLDVLIIGSQVITAS